MNHILYFQWLSNHYITAAGISLTITAGTSWDFVRHIPTPVQMKAAFHLSIETCVAADINNANHSYFTLTNTFC